MICFFPSQKFNSLKVRSGGPLGQWPTRPSSLNPPLFVNVNQLTSTSVPQVIGYPHDAMIARWFCLSDSESVSLSVTSRSSIKWLHWWICFWHRDFLRPIVFRTWNISARAVNRRKCCGFSSTTADAPCDKLATVVGRTKLTIHAAVDVSSSHWASSCVYTTLHARQRVARVLLLQCCCYCWRCSANVSFCATRSLLLFVCSRDDWCGISVCVGHNLEPRRNGRTDRDDVCGGRLVRGPRNHVLDELHHQIIKPSLGGGDVALCQITSTTC